MSAYRFIASNNELYEVKNSIELISLNEALARGLEKDLVMEDILKNGNPDEKVIAHASSEDAFYDLSIHREDVTYYANDYTNKKYSASISLKSDHKNLTNLLNYIKKELEKVDEIEVWKIWMDDIQLAEYIEYHICDLTVNKLKKFFLTSNFKPRCMIVRK